MKRTASGEASETPCYLLAMRDADEDAERVLPEAAQVIRHDGGRGVSAPRRGTTACGLTPQASRKA